MMLILEVGKVYVAKALITSGDFVGGLATYGNAGTLHLCTSISRILSLPGRHVNVIHMILLNTGESYILALNDEQIGLTYRESGARVKTKGNVHK